MKQMVAMEAMTMLLLKRTGVPLKRDVIYMAAADEECGGHAGAGWVVAHRPELIQAEYALNEGGGSGFEINGRRYYPVQTAEKGTVRFRLRTHGRPGHGSVPYDENTILTLAAFLAKLTPDLLPVHGTAHRTLTWSAAFAARSTQYRRVSGRKNWNASPLRYGRSVAHPAWWEQDTAHRKLLEQQARRLDRVRWRELRRETTCAQSERLTRFRFRNIRQSLLASLEERWAVASHSSVREN